MMQFLKMPKTSFAAIVLAGLVVNSATAAFAQKEVVIHSADAPFPESLSSTADGTLYIGSFPGNKVFRALPGAATAEPWINIDVPGVVLGVLADKPSGTLWVCHNGPVGKDGMPMGGAALMAFDLKSGAKKASYPFTGGTGMCNDAVVAPDGTLYATDTVDSRILRLKKGASAFEVWVKDAQLGMADGIVVAGSNIYVNAYDTGRFFRVVKKADGSAGTVTELTTSSKLQNPDGLRWLGGNTFLMVEGAGRLDKVTIDGDKAKIDVLKSGFDGPTSVTLVGKTAWVIEGKMSNMGSPKAKTLPPFVVHPITVQ